MNASNNNGEHEKNINDASLNEYELKIEITINLNLKKRLFHL